ncbi:hypothetical protein ACSBR1_043604 [Camellia fascicularis]
MLLEVLSTGIIEETINDAIDSALDTEDMEEEIDEEVDKVLTVLAGETAAELPEAVGKKKLKQPAGAVPEDEAIGEGADDEEELEEIRDRLARVRS